MTNKSFENAARSLSECGGGTVLTIDGETISGSLFDIQSEINDPDGIGYISLRSDDKVMDVYADEFDKLIETW